MRTRHTSGFTILEMSIVIVIIGLIVGGIILGQSLVRQSQIRAALSEYDRYGKAVKEFIDKYQAIPGDFSNARNQWGALSTGQCNGTTGITTIPTGTATCDGNGNGKIDTSGSAIEYYTVWQHLSNAGLIDGRFTGGAFNTSVPTVRVGYNIPASRLGNAGWTLTYWGTSGLTAQNWADSYGHVMMIGSSSSGTNYPIGGILTAEEALDIDKKLDDGAPGTGNVRTWRTALVPNCTTNDTSQTAQTYNTSNKDQTCSLVFLLGM